jgi:Ca-activated chloride channel family protein
MLAAAEYALLDPWLLLLGVPAVAVVAWRLRRQRAALPTASLDVLASVPQTLRVRLVRVPLLLEALAALALVFALARPVARELVPLRELGVDILLVLDTSSSMLMPDMDAEGKTRMAAARENALAFAAARVDDRVGLLTFALYPELRCPLTLDQDALRAFLRSVETVEPRSAEDGTHIGGAVAQAVKLVEGSEAKSKVVVLLTDGQQAVPGDFPEVSPADAAKLAKDLGVRVHTIGIGQAEQTFLGPVDLDFSHVERLAEATGGRFFRARSAEDLAAVYGEIDQLEKVELEDPRYRTADHFLWPLVGAASLLALALLLELLWLGGAP